MQKIIGNRRRIERAGPARFQLAEQLARQEAEAKSKAEAAAARLSVELVDGASAGPVLEALESAGDLLALSRDGRRLEIEVRMDRDQRTHALEQIADLDDVREARWQR